jgi:uncharacterized protein (TIGR02646 family)
MKRIKKESEPPELTEWKINDKMCQRNQPNWARLPAEIKSKLRTALLNEQGHICCYCERRIVAGEFHTEHLKPKNQYPQLQLEYDNLLCSCQSEIQQREPRHCGNSKGSWYMDDEFISPLDLECEQKFKYTYDGQIIPTTSNDIAAKKTIEKLKLDIDKLNEMRRNAILPFLDNTLSQEELIAFVKAYLVDKSQNNNRFNEFFTTIKHLFVEAT